VAGTMSYARKICCSLDAGLLDDHVSMPACVGYGLESYCC
jgi:hypothetical protein